MTRESFTKLCEEVFLLELMRSKNKESQILSSFEAELTQERDLLLRFRDDSAKYYPETIEDDDESRRNVENRIRFFYYFRN